MAAGRFKGTRPPQGWRRARLACACLLVLACGAPVGVPSTRFSWTTSSASWGRCSTGPSSGSSPRAALPSYRVGESVLNQFWTTARSFLYVPSWSCRDQVRRHYDGWIPYQGARDGQCGPDAWTSRSAGCAPVCCELEGVFGGRDEREHATCDLAAVEPHDSCSPGSQPRALPGAEGLGEAHRRLGLEPGDATAEGDRQESLERTGQEGELGLHRRRQSGPAPLGREASGWLRGQLDPGGEGGGAPAEGCLVPITSGGGGSASEWGCGELPCETWQCRRGLTSRSLDV